MTVYTRTKTPVFAADTEIGFIYPTCGVESGCRATSSECGGIGIRTIYELCADGKGTRAICRYLEEHKIESPGVYEFHTKGTKSKHPDLEHPYLWKQSTVRDMLSNRVYCGDTVNFQTYSKSNKLKKRIKNDPENLLIFENTHEPIVSRELFGLAQISVRRLSD